METNFEEHYIHDYEPNLIEINCDEDGEPIALSIGDDIYIITDINLYFWTCELDNQIVLLPSNIINTLLPEQFKFPDLK